MAGSHAALRHQNLSRCRIICVASACSKKIKFTNWARCRHAVLQQECPAGGILNVGFVPEEPLNLAPAEKVQNPPLVPNAGCSLTLASLSKPANKVGGVKVTFRSGPDPNS